MLATKIFVISIVSRYLLVQRVVCNIRASSVSTRKAYRARYCTTLFIETNVSVGEYEIPDLYRILLKLSTD